VGAAGAGIGADGTPPGAGGAPAGAAGNDGKLGGAAGAPGVAPGTMMDVGALVPKVKRVSARLVAKNSAPKTMVVRVSVLAAPRAENSPPSPDPPPPMPSAPPSER
jgi:hypothetical protein